MHNIAFYKSLAERARKAIFENRFLEFKKEFLEGYKKD
jgi:queuine tRNA-ribosyltransferase